eukprot:TRINITY_DN5258_c0_g1_i2.p1 TRINITY_DN5258_c0_g1~~TRINITY_DN5258_c0_g1_i2.p1  ORF type:complete len:237 (-),score=37.96 TRINITY_DN5258_c0_g1_i2:33-698(-)
MFERVVLGSRARLPSRYFTTKQGTFLSQTAISGSVYAKFKDETGNIHVYSCDQTDIPYNFPKCQPGDKVTLKLENSIVTEFTSDTKSFKTADDFLEIEEDKNYKKQKLTFQTPDLITILETLKLDQEYSAALASLTEVRRKKPTTLSPVPVGVNKDDILPYTFLNRMYSPEGLWRLTRELDSNPEYNSERLLPRDVPKKIDLSPDPKLPRLPPNMLVISKE